MRSDQWIEHFNRNGYQVKEIGSIRKKGVMLEDVFDELRQRYAFREVDSFYGDGAGYHEVLYKGIGVHAIWCGANVGMPSLYVISPTKNDWIALRTELREKGLVR